jgi:hypothetical protein
VADLAPIKERLAKCIRLFGSPERANARNMADRALESIGASWTDLGDWIENSYNEEEMLQAVDIVRKEERQRAQQSAAQSNGHMVLPSLTEMADFCHAQRNWLKDDAQRKFIDEMVFATHHQMQHRLKRGTLGYLVSLYIKHGGKI